MCGISGWLVSATDRYGEAELAALAAALRHRGPDDQGLFMDRANGIALAHNRLSIIDLSRRGRQPMASVDGDLVLVYNGELYNFRELRATLIGKGHRFRSATDTEVVLNAFLEWGDECLTRFHGMFALALWRKSAGRLLLARDPLGVKPLYYHLLAGGRGVAFASELQALLRLPRFQAVLDWIALRQFLEFGYTFSPQRTILRGVYKLEPGHTAAFTREAEPRLASYWQLPVLDRSPWATRAELEERLFSTLSDVVAQHLVADVPIGILLSGGIDSSLLAALAARGGAVRTFSMAFTDSTIDERPFAQAVSRHIGSHHSEIAIQPEHVIQAASANAHHFDDLFADWGLITTHLLYQRCRELGVKVAIVGEGADELFGGYGSFRQALALTGPTDLRLFQLYRRYAGMRHGGEFWRFRRIMRAYLSEARGDWFHAVRLFETRNQLPNHYVMKVDKASMAASVEARVPFLDTRIAAIACAIPPEWLLSADGEKNILRSLARRYGLLPEQVIERRKFGASIAMSWMDESAEFRAFAREVILAGGNWTDELGLRGAMQSYFVRGRSGYRFPWALSIFRNMAWRLLILNLWAPSYLAGAARRA
ncbi:MAG: asparagine synthase (glutamine-hydrolyzing) [Gammaproteobacteria bacterium]